jgi:hypothetical protein
LEAESIVARAKKAAAVGRSKASSAPADKGSNYFDVVRSLSNDPALQDAVDKTEKKMDGKGGDGKG